MDIQTRHALKEDKFAEAAQTTADWLLENRASVIRISILAVVVLGCLVAGLVVYNQRSAAAELAFGKAMDTFTAPLAQPGQATAPGEQVFSTAAERAKKANQQFGEVANRYGMLKDGRNALYFAGITALQLDQNGVAETELNKVADSSDSDLASLAKLALADLYQKTGRSSEAVVLYQHLIAKPTTTVPANEAQLQLANLYGTTNPAEAKRIYAQLKGDKTAAGQIAAQKLGQK